MMVVSLMAIGASVGTVVVKQVQTNVSNSRLIRDVRQVNAAIAIYKTGGGSLDGLTEPQDVLDKMKTVTTTVGGNDREIMFVKDSMIDPRLVVVRSVSGLWGGAGSWGRVYARYNTTTQQFETASSLPANGFAAFDLDASLGTIALAAENRQVTFRQAKNDAWVWDFDPNATAAEAFPPPSVAGTNTGATVTPPAQSAGAVRAQPPTFDPEPPKSDLTQYPLTVQLGNPNNTEISRILYHTEPGPGIDVPYTGPVTVSPGVKVVAFVQSLDTTIYLDSLVASRTYTPDPLTPEFEDNVPETYTYAQLGGPLAPDSPQTEPATPPRITMTNAEDIPDLFENHSHFRLHWTFDGSDPKTSSTARPGADFFEGYPGDSVTFDIDLFGQEDSLTFQYYSRSYNTIVTRDSAVVSRTVGIEKTVLPAPIMSVPPGGNVISGPVELLADVSTGLVPQGYRLFYRVDGDDPGDDDGEPFPGAVAYTSAVTDTYDGSIVVARLYPPADRKNWFTTSEPSSLQIGTPIASLYYAVSGTDKRIHVFDADGSNVVKTSSALFNIECIAADATNTKVYYIEKATSDWRLGMYDVTTGRHTNLGRLTEDWFFDRPVAQPTNLMYFNDGLYYIHENTDNLIKIELNGDNVAQQFRVADIAQDNVAFVNVGDIVADANGKLFISAQNVTATYDLRKMSDYVEISTNPTEVWDGLVATSTGMLGVKRGAANVLWGVSASNGRGSNQLAFNPSKSFADFAGPQPRVQTEPVGGQHYFVTNGRSSIHRLDLSNGRNYLVTTLLPQQPTGIAIDRTNSLIYTVGFDDSNRPGDVFVTRFDLTTGQMTDMGSLKQGAFAYQATTYPVCLTLFNGELYYVPTDTDDLIKITFSGNAVTAQTKVADLLNDTADLGDVDALTIGPDGALYLSRSDGDLLARYEIVALGNFSVVKDTYEADYQALTFDVYGQLHGVFASKSRQVHAVDEFTGATAYKFDTQPTLPVWDITGMFDTTPPPITQDFFATDGSNARIYRFDPDTGWNLSLTSTPWVADVIAFDAESRKIYYLRSGQYDLGVYDMATRQHANLGRLNDTALNYVPTNRPNNLTSFNGALYYIPTNTDDLVKVELDPTGSLKQAYKVIDLSNNTLNLTTVGDLAVDANGILYISSSTVFASFNMKTLSDFTVVAPTEGGWRHAGLAFTLDGRLKGARLDDQRVLHTVNLADGTSQGYIPNIPFRSFTDMAGPQSRVPVDVPQGVYYFAQENSSVIRELNLSTGENRILTWAAPWNIGGIAYDPETKVIYYTETPGGTSQTHVAKYEVELDRHTEIGSLMASGLGYVPTAMPKHLVYFCGDLYYVAPNTDDLVKVTIDDRQILATEKVADINANGSIPEIGAVAVDGSGWLWMGGQSPNYLGKFNLYTRNRYSRITTSSGSTYHGLTFDASNVLNGFPTADAAKVYTVDAAGNRTLRFPTTPLQAVWDVTGNNSCPPPDIPGNWYGVGGGNRRIYKFDPESGATGTMTNTAPFNLRAVARDPDNDVLYYLEDVPSDFRLGSFTVASGTHRTLGYLQDAEFLYSPAYRPSNLFFYEGALFYIATNTDDLVMITTNGSVVTGQFKVADLTNNTVNFGSVGDVAVDATGRAFASGSNGAFFSFSMKTLSGYSVLASSTPFWQGMIFTDEGAFYGTPSSAQTSIYSVSKTNGAGAYASTSVPATTFWDMAGHETSATWERSDSLWAIVQENAGSTSAWSYYGSTTSPNGGTSGGVAGAWTEGRLSYDAGARVFTGEITVNNAVLSSGNSWKAVSFVIGEGSTPSPSSSSPTHAWVVMDYSAGEPRLSVYRYDSSFDATRNNPVVILSSNQTSGDLTVTDSGTSRTFAFTLDAAAIQRALSSTSWKGIGMGATIGATIKAWSQPTVGYSANGEITTWIPLPTGGNLTTHSASFALANQATTGITGRLVEFKNYRTPLIRTTDWGIIHVRNGAGRTPLVGANGIAGMTVNASGQAFFVSNTPVTVDGVTYNRPMFRMEVGQQQTGDALMAEFAGDLMPAITAMGGAWDGLVTGLATGQDGVLYGVLRLGGASSPDKLFAVLNLLKTSTGSLVNVVERGTIVGGGYAGDSVEDISASSTGTLFVSDVADGHVYEVSPATGAILSLANSESGTSYGALAVNPADDDMVAANGSNTAVMKVRPGSGDDTAYFDYAARFGYDSLRAMAFFNGTFTPTEVSPPYYAANQTTSLWGVDPVTGATTLVTSTAPFAADSLAFDRANNVIYYVENADSPCRLAKYDLATAQHTILGTLSGGFAYNVTAHPRHLVCFGTDLYYIHPQTDDLVKVEVSASAIVAQTKAADLNGNTSLGLVSAAALNDAGVLYFANATTLFKYNLRSASSFATVATGFGAFPALMWNSSASTLHGVSSAAPTRIDLVNATTGAITPGAVTSPVLSASDLSGGNSAVPLTSLASSTFAVTGGNKTIHVLNPVTGVNSVLTSTAPFNVRAIAMDVDNALLYYTEDTTDTATFRLASYNINTDVHTVLGNLRATGGLSYVPTASPSNLAFYGDALWYIPRNSDDLVRIVVAGGAVLSQTKMADIRGNTPFTDVGDIAISPGGLMCFSDKVSGNPVYRFDLSGMNGFQTFGNFSRAYDALSWFGGKIYAGAVGVNTVESWTLGSTAVTAGASVATSPARSFVDYAAPVPGSSPGRSGSLWAVVETPAGHLVELRNYRNAANVEAVDFGEIYYQDGASRISLTANSVKIQGLAITNYGRAFFTQNNAVTISGRGFERPLFYIDLADISLGSQVVATFVGDLKPGLLGSANINAGDRITGLSIGADGALYGAINWNGNARDTLFRLSSLRVNGAQALTDVSLVGQFAGSGYEAKSVEDIAFAPDGTLWVSDDTTDSIYGVDKANAQIGSLYSEENNIQYLALAVDPSDSALIASHVSGANEKVFRVVTPGSAGDTVLWDYRSRYGWTRCEAMAFYTRPFTGAEGALYAVSAGSRRIHQVNPLTGAATLIDESSPTPTGVITALAYDSETFALYYTDNADASGHFRLYCYSLGSGTHTLIGQVDGGSFAYNPLQPLSNLTAVDGALLFFARDTDDLVRLTIDGGAIASIQKIADVSNDTLNLGEVGDLSVRDDGVMYFSVRNVPPAYAAANNRLWRYSLATLSGLQTVAVTTQDYKALSFSGGNLVGNRAAAPTYLYLVDSNDGTDNLLAATAPALDMVDFAAGEPDIQLPTPTIAPYYGINGSRTIFTIDPAGGGTTVLTTTMPFVADALAHDKAGDCLFYVEGSDLGTRLGKYSLAAGTHVVLGDLTASGFAYTPGRHPRHLASYNGDLYYIATDSDDLVRVRVSENSILSQEKVSDLNNDLSLGVIQAATVDDSGNLYYAGASRLGRVNLRNGGAPEWVSTSFAEVTGLLWNSTGALLYASAQDTPIRLDVVNQTTGVLTAGSVSHPSVSFVDLAGGNTAPAPASPLYYGVNRTTTIYRIDPVDGTTTSLPTSISFNADSVAYDQARGQLYVVENTNTNTRLGRYDLNTNAFTSLGNIRASGWSFTPTERPQHLAFYDGALYYINYNSSSSAMRDDLIRIRVSDVAILAQEKVTDINGNAALNRVTAAAVDDDGTLWFSAGSELRRYSLKYLNGLATLTSSAAVYNGLLWHNADTFLYGVNASTTNTRNQFTKLSPSNGGVLATVTASPKVNGGFYDIAGGNRATAHPSYDVPAVYIGGEFASSTGNYRNIARLTNNGSLDLAFNPGTGANAPVRAVRRQDDGKVLVGGEFTEFAGQERRGLARLQETGALDTTFTPQVMATGLFTEVTTDWSEWSSFVQNSALTGAEPWQSTRNAYFGLSSSSGGTTGFGSQTWNNVSGSGVNMTLHYSQNMTEVGGTRDGQTDGPDFYGDTSEFTGGVNPDRRITGHTALRFNSDRTGSAAPTTVVASFSEPVYINQLLLGSLSQIGGAATSYGSNVLPNGSFESGSGWNNGPNWFPSSDHPNRAQARTNIQGSGYVSSWSVDKGDWIQDASRATDGNRFLYLYPTDQSWNFCIGQNIGVSSTTNASMPLRAGRNYRISFDCVPFNPSLPDGQSASPGQPAVEFTYTNTSGNSVYGELYNLTDETTGLAPGMMPATSWSSPAWRRISAYFTAPSTSSSNRYMTLWVSLLKGVGGVQSQNYMADYNVIVFDDLSSTSDVDGKTWVGGNITSPSSFQMGSLYTPSGSERVVVVGGAINGTASSPAINFGSTSNSKLVLKDTASRGNRPINWNGGGSQATRMIIDPTITETFATMRADLQARSAIYRQLPSNSSVIMPNNQSNARRFVCTPGTVAGQNGISVFNINASDLFGNGSLAQVEITSSTGNASSINGVIINVAGTNVNWSSNFNFVGDFTSNTWRQKVIWNFYEANTLACGSHQMNGAVLAPWAAVTSSNNFDGSLVCRSLTTTGECHRVPFTSTAVTNVGTNAATSGMLFDNLKIEEVTTSTGYYENVLVRAFATPNATGAPVAADTFENLSLRSEPLLGTSADPLTVAYDGNVRVNPSAGTNLYHAVGVGRQEENRYGRVAASFTSQAVQSVAVTFWTSNTTQNVSGQIFPSFNGAVTANAGTGTMSIVGFTRANPPLGRVYSILTEPDGRILVGGDFGQVNGVSSRNIARLLPDGTLDSSFNVGQGPNGPVYALERAPDGSVLAGGGFNAWSGQPSGTGLVKLSVNGARDTSFAPGFSGGATDSVNWVKVDPSDGRIFAGGRFSAPKNGIVKLNADGSRDTSFNPGTGVASAAVNSGVLQSGGKVVIGGDFTSVAGTGRNRVARLNANGSVDTSFNPGTGFDNLVQAMVLLQGSSYIHTGGAFSSYQGNTRNKVSLVGSDAGDAGLTPWGPSTLTISRIWSMH